MILGGAGGAPSGGATREQTTNLDQLTMRPAPRELQEADPMGRTKFGGKKARGEDEIQSSAGKRQCDGGRQQSSGRKCPAVIPPWEVATSAHRLLEVPGLLRITVYSY